MCFVDPGWMSWQSSPLSRRRFLSGGFRAGAAAAAIDWSKSLLLPGVAEGAETPSKSGGPGSAGVNMRRFGTDGWEITFGNKTILFDPCFSLFDTCFGAGKVLPYIPLQRYVADSYVYI